MSIPMSEEQKIAEHEKLKEKYRYKGPKKAQH
jgi:hypothetical protein